MITVNINNQPYSFPKEIALVAALEHLNFPKKGIAVAVDNAIVSKSDWETCVLQQNAQVLVIQATQGG